MSETETVTLVGSDTVLPASWRSLDLLIEWYHSRSSGIALTVAYPSTHASDLDLQRRENESRDLATPRVLSAALMAFTESRYIYARTVARGLGLSYMVENLVADESHPSYTEMRGFLVGELDARYVDACAAAFWRIESHNRLFERSWGAQVRHWHGGRPLGERGWL